MCVKVMPPAWLAVGLVFVCIVAAMPAWPAQAAPAGRLANGDPTPTPAAGAAPRSAPPQIAPAANGPTPTPTPVAAGPTLGQAASAAVAPSAANAACVHLLGSGTGLRFVIVPAGFDDANPVDVADFGRLAQTIADGFERVIPYAANLDLFSIWRVDDYRGRSVNSRTVCRLSRSKPITRHSANSGTSSEKSLTRSQ